MLRFFSLALLGLALVAGGATAQTTPTHKATAKAAGKPAPRTVSNKTPAARKADPLRGTNDNGQGQSGYAAPGEPITSPATNGKNTPPYDGPAAGHGASSTKTTLQTPK